MRHQSVYPVRDEQPLVRRKEFAACPVEHCIFNDLAGQCGKLTCITLNAETARCDTYRERPPMPPKA